MPGQRNASLAIGIGQAKPLPFLRGAINGAKEFHNWAEALGYESKCLTDEEGGPVTMARLRRELESLLGAGKLQRLLLYFAGHGFIRDAGEGLWLLSDWKKERRAVGVEGLKRHLQDYDIRQVAIFADACRSLPREFRVADVTVDLVLGEGPFPGAKAPALDRFVASQDGTETFMIPGVRPEESRCLFTGVLLEGLWAHDNKATSVREAGKVISGSLGDYLRKEVPRVAKRYGWQVEPEVSWSFAEGEDIYFGDFGQDQPPQPPVFPDWPDPLTLQERDADLSSLSSVVASIPSELKNYAAGIITKISSLPRLEADRIASRALETRLRTKDRPLTSATGAGFLVEGARVKAVWTNDRTSVNKQVDTPSWSVGEHDHGPLRSPTPILVELAGGMLAALTILPSFVGSVICDRQGVAALVYFPSAGPLSDTAIEATIDAIMRMERGLLRASDRIDFAAALRAAKHAVPVLGAISAYLYDSVGDIDSIRKTAHYYAQSYEAIPYDLALLGQLSCELRDGIVSAKVPVTESRTPRTEKERGAAWTFTATQATSGAVGGYWPWLRQGWAYLENRAYMVPGLIQPGQAELRKYLTPARFTTLTKDGGRRLAEMFRLRRSIVE